MPRISFVDVGQGDCTVATGDSGQSLVIDCPSGQYRTAAEELDRRGHRNVRAAIITHSDEDHAGGMLDLLEFLAERFDGELFFNVDSVLTTPVSGPDYKIAGRRRRALINRTREYGDRVKDARAGTNGNIDDLSWQLLAPTLAEIMDALADGDPNLASGIVLLSVDGINTIVGGMRLLGLGNESKMRYR